MILLSFLSQASVVAIGTYGLFQLNIQNFSLSPFNVQESVLMTPFTVEQVRGLIESWLEDRKLQCDSDLVDDVSDEIKHLSDGYLVLFSTKCFINTSFFF